MSSSQSPARRFSSVLLLGVEALGHALEELVDLVDRDAVEVAVRGGVDLNDLVRDRERAGAPPG